MIRYHDNVIKKIRSIRISEKLSYFELSKRFSIPSGTIRNWCHEDGLSRRDALTRTYQARRDSLKASEIFCVPDINQLSKDQAKLLAGILYGCEGAKYPASNRVDFANSDPFLMATFYKLLTKGFDIDSHKLSLHLQIHTSYSYEQLKKFWSNTLGLPNIKFMKPTITSPFGGKHRLMYKGTCTLRYNDYRIQLKLLGIFETFIGTKK